jgi:hypothetical protein
MANANSARDPGSLTLVDDIRYFYQNDLRFLKQFARSSARESHESTRMKPSDSRSFV